MIKVSNVQKTIQRLKIDFEKETLKRVGDKTKSVVEALKLATPVDTGEARDGWRIEGKNIVNDVSHISQLNEGSSTQAPSNFVEKTVLSQEGVRPSGTIVVYK
jgi:hypothetical protein